MFRGVAAASLAFLALLCTPAAASDNGAADLSILDARSRKPIVLARVLVTGPEGRIAYTDKSGSVILDDLAPGDYRVSIYSAGFSIEKTTLTVLRGQTTVETIALSVADQPKIIASVTATIRPSVALNAANASSPLTASDGGLAAALDKLPAIGREGTGFAVAGLTAGSTPTTVDGVPVAGGGLSAALSPIGLDLFQSVSVRPTGSSGGPGIDLATSDPTIAFSTQGTQSVDSRAGSAAALTVRGTAGFVGYVFRGVRRTQVGTLNGLRFQDESGLFYDHRDFASGSGWLAKLRFPLGTSQSFLLESSAVNANDQSACNIASGGTPCGSGPGNYSGNTFYDQLLRYSALIGYARITLDYGRSTNLGVHNFVSRFVNGNPDPFFDSSRAVATRTAVQIQMPADSENDIGIDFSAFRQSFVASLPGAAPQKFESGLSSLVVSDRIASTSRLRGYGSPPFARGRPTVRVARTFYFNTRDYLSAQFFAGETSLPPLPAFPAWGTLLDPPSLGYDCLHRHVFATGNSDVPGVPADTGSSFAYEHETSSSAFQISVSRDILSDALVPTLTLGSLTGTNAISLSELQAISRFYGTSGACGVATNLSPQDLVLNVGRNAKLLTTRSTVSFAGRLRSGLVVAPFLQFTNSLYNVGAGWIPTPSVPLVRAGLLTDYLLDHGQTELLAYLDFSSRNNASATPAYLAVNLGVSRKLSHGALTLSLTNSTGVNGEDFASSSFAAPYPNGIVPIAQPFGRPKLQFTYNFTSGSSGPPQRVSALEALASIAQPANDVFIMRLTSMPDEPPTHPFEPETDLPTCTPELVSRVKAILDIVRGADMALPGDSPAADVPLPADPQLGILITEHIRSVGKSFTLLAKDKLTGLALSFCMTLHSDTTDDARRRGLYVPEDFTASDDAVFFDKRVGAYTLEHATQRTNSVAARPSLVVGLESAPAVPPRNPFAIKASCPASGRVFSAVVLAALSHDVLVMLRGQQVADSPYYRLGKHSGSSVAWISISFLDPLSIVTIAQCAHIVGATDTELEKRGVDAVPFHLNFTPNLGLYEKIR